MSSLVSVIMPAFNNAELIGESLQSLLDQTYHNWECVIVNDGSQDNTEEKIKPFLKDERFIYITQENQGAAVARNNAIAESRGDCICFLDADDVYLPESIQRRMDFIKQHPVKFLYTDFYWIKKTEDFENYQSLTSELHQSNHIQRLGGAEKFDINYYVSDRTEFLKHNVSFMKAWTGTVMIDAKFWKNTVERFFDSALSAGEDMDMWWHVILHPDVDKVGFIDEPLSLYRFYNNSWTKKNFLGDQFVYFQRIFDQLPQYLSRKESARCIYDAMWANFSKDYKKRRAIYRKLLALDSLSFKYWKEYMGVLLREFR